MTGHIEIANSVAQERISRMSRDRDLPPADVEDPSSWPYSDHNGPVDDDIFPADERYTHVVLPRDAVDIRDFTVGPRETLCQKCWLIHRPESECP